NCSHPAPPHVSDAPRATGFSSNRAPPESGPQSRNSENPSFQARLPPSGFRSAATAIPATATANRHPAVRYKPPRLSPPPPPDATIPKSPGVLSPEKRPSANSPPAPAPASAPHRAFPSKAPNDAD